MFKRISTSIFGLAFCTAGVLMLWLTVSAMRVSGSPAGRTADRLHFLPLVIDEPNLSIVSGPATQPPSPTPTSSPTSLSTLIPPLMPTLSATATTRASETPLPVVTRTPLPSIIPTLIPSSTPTAPPSATPIPTLAATSSPAPPVTPSPTPAPTGTATPDPGVSSLFLETFDGTPAAPMRWTSPDWDITIHQRDQDRLYEMKPMQAQHGPNCEPPPATRTITAHEDNLYICHNHMMTANYGISDHGGYGMVYFAPARLLDTTEDFTIEFDMSTYRVNPARNWVDVWITPYDKNVQLTLNEWLPDAQGPAPESIQILLTQENTLMVKLHEDGEVVNLIPDSFTPMDERFALSSLKRMRFFIGVEDGVFKVGLPIFGLWWYTTEVPEMLTREHWQESVVQFGHHSYTPYKLCDYQPDPVDCETIQADTFHWDNIRLSPVTPFTLVQGSPRLITSSTDVQTFTANSPAPVNAHLRFAGIGDALEVSFDSGATWQAAVQQVQTYPGQEGHFSSYWMPIPAGTTTVQFRGNNWWGGEWAARDISIWAK